MSDLGVSPLVTPGCCPPRRQFLADVGLGFTGLALGAMLHRDGVAADPHHKSHQVPDGRPHHPARAKNVIWIFLSGGYSQMETWDPKPALNKYAGKSYEQTPLPNPLKDPLFELRSRDVVGGTRPHAQIFPMQVGFRRYGELGIGMTDWWP